jgi:multidrug efflux pump subunit AcrA (membrane-fusion protein)
MSSRNAVTDEPKLADRKVDGEGDYETTTVVVDQGRSRKVLLAAAAGLVLLLLVYLFLIRESTPAGEGAAGVTAPAPAPPAAVSTVPAVSRELPTYIQASGSLEPFEQTDVAPLVGGKVVAVSFEEGQFVRRGQVLVRLDDRDARIRIEQAQAAVTQARANVDQARANLGLGRGDTLDPTEVAEVRSARAQLDLADANERRYRALVETGDIPRAQYDEVKARADTARQAYEAALAKARAGGAGIDVARSGVDAAEAQLAAARKALSDMVIAAPLSGYVSNRPVAVGEWVTTSTPVATIVQNDTLKLMLQVSEADAARVRTGMAVTLRVDAFPDREFGGTVSAIIPALDPTSRALTAVVQVLNPDGALKPGMFATARVVEPAAGRVGILVPREALVGASGGASQVFVVSGDRATARVVQTGREVDGLVEIVTGVQEGEEVVTSGASSLQDGQSIVRSAR